MELRVLIVAEHASARFGGEAALPLHYFRVLRRRNIPAWLVTQQRTRRELEALFPQDAARMVFVPDTLGHRFLWRLSRLLPARLSAFTVGFAMRLLTQTILLREPGEEAYASRRADLNLDLCDVERTRLVADAGHDGAER